MFRLAQRRGLVSENGGAWAQSCKRTSVSRESGSMCHAATKSGALSSIACRNQSSSMICGPLVCDWVCQCQYVVSQANKEFKRPRVSETPVIFSHGDE